MLCDFRKAEEKCQQGVGGGTDFHTVVHTLGNIMPAKSKANKTCIANLNAAHQTQKTPSDMARNNSQSDSVHEMAQESAATAQDTLNLDNTHIDTNNERQTDDDGNENEDYSDNESEFEDSDSKEEAAQLSALEVFMATLTLAQQTAEEAEHMWHNNTKHPKHYLGNSECNKQHKLQQVHELARKGFPSVAEFFIHKQRKVMAMSTIVNEGIVVETEREYGPRENSVAEQLVHYSHCSGRFSN
ncbi:hypothetical protein BDQ17DRAFT_1336413 [Cyathus striatus]|nr:hypothetical protein BDQ17DRAFT_1336413 [Cyathus striatus]